MREIELEYDRTSNFSEWDVSETSKEQGIEKNVILCVSGCLI